MILSPRFEDALTYACTIHADQTRASLDTTEMIQHQENQTPTISPPERILQPLPDKNEPLSNSARLKAELQTCTRYC